MTTSLLKGVDVLEEKERFERFSRPATSCLSTYTFANIFLWSDFFNFRFEVIDECLCVFAHHEPGCFLYLPPLGEDVSPETISRCFDEMERINKKNGVSRMENAEWRHREVLPAPQFRWIPRSDEYCYYRPEIAALQGNDFKSKRSSYNQFIRHYAHEFLPFEEGMDAACDRLYEQWAAERHEHNTDDIYRHMLEENRSVHRVARRYYRQLGLIGRVVKVDGVIKGYTFGVPLNEQVFGVLFEVGDLSVSGLPVFIFRELCNDPEVQKFPFINAMDDFGVENLAQVKLSFRPIIRLSSYTVSRQAR